VILGGVLTATVFSLYVVPALYASLGGGREAELGLVDAA
jgi:Cu/Ag efflux pump CusA